MRHGFMNRGRYFCEGVLLAALVGCGSGGKASTDAPAVEAAYQALLSEVAACGQGVASCVRAAAPDPTALEACRAELSDCADAALAPTADLADAAQGCAQDGGACFQGAAGDPEGVMACRDELAACLGIPTDPDDDPAVDEDADAAEPGGPAADCIGALLGCIEAGDDAASCAGDVSACVLDALPTPDAIAPPGLGGMPMGVPPVPVPTPGDDEPADDEPADDEPADDEPADDDSEGVPDMIPLPDPADVAAAAAECLEVLHACVSGGNAPPTCLAEVRACAEGLAP